jgi:hypothetical protein
MLTSALARSKLKLSDAFVPQKNVRLLFFRNNQGEDGQEMSATAGDSNYPVTAPEMCFTGKFVVAL